MCRGRTKSCKSCKLFRFQRLNVVFLAPLLDIEAGAGFGGVFVVAVDGGDVVLFHQVLHQLEQGEVLERGTGVGRASVGIKAADIDDADALGVVARTMGTDLLNGAARVDAAVRIDDIMIADVVPAETLMVATDALHSAVGIGSGGGAVDDYFGDCSHGANGFSGFNGHLGAATVLQHTGQRGASRLPAVRSACWGWCLGGSKIEDVDGVAFGVMAGVFEGEFVVGEGVVGGRLHQAVDEDSHGALGIGRLGEGDFGGEVHAVEGENRRCGEGNLFLGGHYLAAGECKADNGLCGGAASGGVGSVDTCDGKGSLGDLDGGAFLGDGRHIFACFGTAAGDGLQGAAHGAGHSVVDFLTCCGCGGQLVGQR